MEPKLTQVSDNNNDEKSGELQLSPRTLLLNTFTVPLRRRDPGQRLLLILAIASFVIFEAVFPVDDTLLYLHFKVDILISILVGLADNVTIMCQIQDKFNFTEEDFTNQQAFWTLCMVIGQFVLTPILQDYVKLRYYQ